MATLREVQKQQTRQLLLDTGLELFESKGYAATTIDDIAGGRRHHQDHLYLHFASKAQLMGEVVKTVDAILTSVDDPPLSTVVELGKRDLVRTWINRKFDQWEATRPYLHAVYQAAPMEPEVAKTLEDWFRDVAADMTAGLDRADGSIRPAGASGACSPSANSSTCRSGGSAPAGSWTAKPAWRH